MQEPGKIKRLSIAVAVDGLTPVGKDGKPGPYAPRSAEEMKRIEQLVRSAVGYDQERGDQVSVVNVRFDRPDGVEGAAAASPLSFDKNDLMRAAELGVMLVVAVLIILFVVRPLIRPGREANPVLALAGAADGGAPALGAPTGMGESGQVLALPPGEIDQRIDIARIEGQVKASSVRKVAEFVERHPEESISILRSWLHES